MVILTKLSEHAQWLYKALIDDWNDDALSVDDQ